MPTETRTTATFEVATLADALKKASRVAAGKGAAYDKAAGIVLDIDPQGLMPCIVSATNLEIFQKEWIEPTEVSGARTRWRVPSELITKVVSSLPLGAGQTVTISEVKDEGKKYSHLALKAKRVKSRINLMEHEYYPEWAVFDPTDLVEVKDLGAKIRQVEWAADNGGAPLGGIRMDGQTLICTDRYKLVCVPLKVDNLTELAIVPAGLLGQLLSKSGEVKVGFNQSGNMLFMPDDYTQIMAVLYDTDYPNPTGIMSREFPNSVEINRGPFVDMVNRGLAFAMGDRFPVVSLYFGKGEIACMVANSEIGHLGDVIEAPGCDHARVLCKFTPGYLLDSITNAPNEKVTLHYNAGNAGSPILVDGGSGYRAWVMPRKEAKA